jgi:site-specific DNA-methyltransferase (adenine-specific)
MGYGDHRRMIDIHSFNPDVLSCLANLSNDEVFTPPKLANEILDLLPQSLWNNKAAKFLDPCAKTGVFLREIAKRLLKGLEKEIPDLHTRINHIFTNQIYGIAITELTAHLTRRSVYCSKHAAGKYSVCDIFDDDSGNIQFERVEHSWKDGKCVFCGANQENYDRGGELETHAYQFIHTETPEEIFNMKFDVIVGNPPYQISTGGSGVQATPIYNKFILQSKKMTPRFLSMIVPARWFSGGFGLDSFRDEMLHDNRVREIHDYPEASDCFSGVQIKGGICYFLWDRDNPGKCKVITHKRDNTGKPEIRPLLEENCDVFIRYNEAVDILHKVWNVSGRDSVTMESIASSQRPFGLPTNFIGNKKQKDGNVVIYGNKGIEYCSRNEILKNHGLIDKIKIFIPRAGSGSDSFPHQILGKPFLVEANTACTETYIVIGPFSSKKEGHNVISYTNKIFQIFSNACKANTRCFKKSLHLCPHAGLFRTLDG